MTSKEAFNIIQGLRKLGANDSLIVTFIEYIETSDPKLLDKIPNIKANIQPTANAQPAQNQP